MGGEHKGGVARFRALVAATWRTPELIFSTPTSSSVCTKMTEPAILRTAPYLPVEILEQIFQHLARNHVTLAACTRVCRSWSACANTFLCTHQRVGRFRNRNAMRNIALDIEELATFLEERPNVRSCIQSLELAWPCNVRKLESVLKDLPRLRRLSLWGTQRRGASDIMLVSMDGTSRRADVTGGILDVSRCWLIPQVALFPPSDPSNPSPRRDMQSLLDFLALFHSVDKLFLDGGQTLYNQSLPPVVYPQHFKVRYLSLGRYFCPSSACTSELLLNVLCTQGVDAVYMRSNLSSLFVDELIQRGGSRDARAMYLPKSDGSFPYIRAYIFPSCASCLNRYS